MGDCSVALEADLCSANIDCLVSEQFGLQILRRVFEVQPGALRAQLKAAVGVAGPAVVPLVKEVVRVGVVHVLNAEVVGSVEPARALHAVGHGASEHVGGGDVCEEVGRDEGKDGEEGDGEVLLRDHPHFQVPVKRLLKNCSVGGHCEVELVVAWDAVVAYYTLQGALHVAHSFAQLTY